MNSGTTPLEAKLGRELDISGLERVEVVRVAPPANGPILMIVAGLVMLAAAMGELGWIGVPAGLATIAAAVGWWAWKKPTFQLQLTASEGKSVPFESASREEVEGLAAAIEARRGS